MEGREGGREKKEWKEKGGGGGRFGIMKYVSIEHAHNRANAHLTQK